MYSQEYIRINPLLYVHVHVQKLLLDVSAIPMKHVAAIITYSYTKVALSQSFLIFCHLYVVTANL